jgi:uncharacterized protein (DUF1330 family)
MTAYVVVEVDIKEPEAFAAYRKLGVPSIEQHGGCVLARSDEALALEGDWHPRRIVVLAFETVEAARRWHASPEYQAARKLRLHAGTVRSVAFEGV